MLDFLRAAASYLRPYWRQALLIVLSQAPATAFITLQPLLLRALIDDAIVAARVGVGRRGPGGAELHVSVLEDGDFFGEIALLEDVRRTATVRALTPCLLLVLDRGEFQELLAEAPALRQVFQGAAQARRAALCDESAFLPGPLPL
jgi:CRP-like cAMP-binding protein